MLVAMMRFMITKFYCNGFITKLSPRERWWLHACTACNKGTIPYGSAYKCPDKDCGATGGAPRYLLCYLGSDDTRELEFVFFEKDGRKLIGKPVLNLIRASVPHAMSVGEAIQFTRTDQSIPRDLASIVSKKYRPVVSVSSKSFSPQSNKNSFLVHRVEPLQGNQPKTHALGRKPGLLMAPTSSFGGNSGLNPAGKALVDDLLAGHPDSPGTTMPSPGPPTPDSLSGIQKVMPQTPPSVGDPSLPMNDKTKAVSNVQKEFFRTASLDHELGNKTDLVPPVYTEEVAQIQREEVNLPVVVCTHTPPAPAATDSTDKTPIRKRMLSLKDQAAATDDTVKKKKT